MLNYFSNVPLGIGSTTVSELDGMTLLYVPADEFIMGSDLGFNHEKPPHMVYLDSYWLDQTEITNSMYAMCVDAGQCDSPKQISSSTRPDYFSNSRYGNYPVIYINWNMANAYCEWAGRRLPTEAEWEKAARGKDERNYPWGNLLPKNTLLNHNNNIGDTTESGIYSAGVSPYGIYDMAGNVWEWVSSVYKNYPYSSLDGREESSALGSRVLRGGAWSSTDGVVRSVHRYTKDSSFTSYNVGFRCAKDASE